MRFRASGSIMVVALALLDTSVTRAQTWDLDSLRSFAGLTPSQWKAINSGEVQAKVLDTHEKTEVAVVGAARLRASTACFLKNFQDIERFKKNPDVLSIRKFSHPIQPADLAGFNLEASDLAALQYCREGNCNVKLSAEAIRTLAHDVDWSQPDHGARAESVFRDDLLSYLTTYVRKGNPALIEYRDKSVPLSLAREFRGVLDARPGLGQFVPEFQNYLADYPNRPLPGVSSFFYWSRERFGLKPVSSITQVFLYTQPGRAAIASKQLYASHYFDASMGLTAALDDLHDPSHPAMYLVYLNRSRVDLLGGFWGGLKRAILNGRLRDGMRKNLTDVVHKLESSCAEDPHPNSFAP